MLHEGRRGSALTWVCLCLSRWSCAHQRYASRDERPRGASRTARTSPAIRGSCVRRAEGVVFPAQVAVATAEQLEDGLDVRWSPDVVADVLGALRRIGGLGVAVLDELLTLAGCEVATRVP